MACFKNLFLLLSILGIYSLNCTNGMVENIKDLNADCYGTPGDINLALLSGFSDRGDKQLCSLEPQPWITLFYQFYQGFVYTIDKINKMEDILPNITLGYIIMDTCWRDLAALGQTLRIFNKSSAKIPCEEFDYDGFNIHEVVDKNISRHMNNNGSKAKIELIQSENGLGKKAKHFTCSEDLPELDVVGVVGPGSSAESVMVGGLLSVLQVPVLATLATSDELSDKSKFGYFTRLVSPDKFQVETILHFLDNFNWTFASILYSEGIYGESAAKMIQKGMDGIKICSPISEMLPNDMGPAEAEEIAIKLSLHMKARVIIAFIQQSQISQILEQLTQRGLDNYFIWISGDSLADADLGPAANGAFVVNHKVEPVPEFEEYYLNLTPAAQPGDPWIKFLWQMFFGCSWNENGKEQASEYAAISQTKMTPVQSCLTYSNKTNKKQHVSSSASLYMDGALAFSHALHNLIETKCPSAFADKAELRTCVTGPELLASLRKLRFEGYSGNISFDLQGDRLGKYSIGQYKFNQKQTYTKISEFDKQSDTFIVYEDKIDWTLFVGGQGTLEGNPEVPPSVCSLPCGRRHYAIRGDLPCCWECIKCRSNEVLIVNNSLEYCVECPSCFWPDDNGGDNCTEISPSYLKWNSLPGIVLMVTGICLMSFTFMTGTWLIVYRQVRLLKASSRELCLLLLIGITMAVITSIVMLLIPTNIHCQVAMVGYHLSVAIVFIPVLVKTFRVYRIFTCARRGITKPSFISNRAVFILTFMLITLQMILTTVSAIISPTMANLRMPVRSEKLVELFCDTSLTGFLPPLIFNLIIISMCAVLGFLTRQLPENFNESWYIFVSVSTTVFTWLVFLPTYFTINVLFRVVLLVSSLLINGGITLVCLFAPKMYAIHFYDEHQLKYLQTQGVGPHLSNVNVISGASSSFRVIHVKPDTSGSGSLILPRSNVTHTAHSNSSQSNGE